MTSPLLSSRIPQEARATCELRRINLTRTPEQVLPAFHRADTPAILESTMYDKSYGRWSMFMADPIDECRMTSDEASLDALREAKRRWPNLDRPSDSPPFVGGWVGYLSYELGAQMESVHRKTSSTQPIALLHLYDTVALFHHDSQCWTLAAIQWPDGIAPERPDAAERLDHLEQRLTSPALEHVDDSLRTNPGKLSFTGCTLPPPLYLKRVQQTRDFIAAGDIFQMNLTNRYSALTPQSPWQIYDRLRQANPSFYGCLLPWRDTSVISSSPELFLRLRNRSVTTRPIKGTARRTGNDVADQALAETLASSEKETSELNMIIDLLRNDLGRVAEFGSVKVDHPGAIEMHPTVIHRVATITSQLRQNCDEISLLQASFPGGSITGCPKIRAMQLIHQLEPDRRGIYCGAIGWIGLDGDMEMNIAIRTMTLEGRVLTIGSGGAILADSDPESELEEIRAKARAMMLAAGEADHRAWERM
ncbi:MAG: anthranilate synthase component I family protein [Phycisphaerae bacterium]